MNCVAEVVATEAVALRRFDHAPGVPHRDPERERASGYGVNFVESGAFRARTLGGWREIGGDSLFVTTPGLEFSCAHDDQYPRDRCLSVAGMSVFHFARVFAELEGQTPHRYLRDVRLTHARSCGAAGAASIGDAAHDPRRR